MTEWRIYIFALLFLLPGTIAAQKVLSEGIIRYKVTMDKPANNISTKGSYTIYLKNSNIRKELKMDNGFEFVMILEGKEKGYLLKKSNEKNYAVLIDMNQHNSKYEQYKSYELKTTDNNKEIAGYTAQKAEVQYKDGTKSELSITKELQLSNQFIFDRYPGIEYLPLEFVVKNDEGMTMHFVADKVTLKPLESGYFRVPEGYVVINRDEATPAK